MAHLNHFDAYKELQERTLAGISEHFPVKGRLKTLVLDGLEVRDQDEDADNIEGQKSAKMEGGSWVAPVFAKLRLIDNETGKVIDSKMMRVAEIPKPTRRHSYILDGQEYQVSNQWQLKPGAYVRRQKTGELETQFNIAGKPPFKVKFDPTSKQFMMTRRKTEKIPLYPVMRAMGVDDTDLEKVWGKEILSANKSVRGVNTALGRFYKADKKVAATDHETAHAYVVDALKSSELRPDAAQVTLGKPFTHVNGDVLSAATSKLLKVHGGAPEDDRDSLEFKDLRSVADFAYDKLTYWKTKRDLKAKFDRKINFANGVRDVIKFDMFNGPIRDTFKDNTLSATPSQHNPVEMLSNARQTTVTGEGGIKSDNQINTEVKYVNPSHFGFLDPVHTPESDKSGVVLHLPLGVQKVGNEAKLPVYNIKTGKTELVTSAQFLSSRVVLPDQVTWKNGVPSPVSKTVQLLAENNKVQESSFNSAKYVLRHSSMLFGAASNMIPFINSNSGNRASYAAAQISQAVSLHDREAPLVQVGTGSNVPGSRTFEEVLGAQSGHPALVAGTIERVTTKTIGIKDAAGKVHTVHLYDNYPLNDPKAVLHSTPTVKVGDKVGVGQSVADTNFMKDGALALGRNLRVAYLPFKGYNFEDGVVISETAAKKLSSVHLHKPSIEVDDKTVLDTRKFQIQHSTVYKRDQYSKLGADGIVRVGMRVDPGDPLILAMRPYNLQDRMGIGAVRRSLSGIHVDASVRWESDHPGEVVAVARDKRGNLSVHVRTVESMQVGDKITGRHGNKGIISLILPDSEMPRTKDGQPIEVALNPSGVPGRVNLGQVLETAAAKIAEKTKKPYIVNNFSRDEAITSIKKELATHGLSDTEELHDPSTGVSLGKVLTGPQYMLKLTHQVDKKIAARAGMVGGGGEAESYNSNLMPSSGGKAAGQRVDPFTQNVLLAHGAKANIREMQTWKSEGQDPQAKEGKGWRESQHLAVWEAIQNGTPIPTPRSTYTFQKFTDMLRGAGINVEKRGHTLQLSPLTDKQILAMSSGALPNPTELLESKVDKNGDLKPRPGGLFDPHITGGHSGRRWSHIKLAEPVPNPVYEDAIRGLTGLKTKEYGDIVTGVVGMTKLGKIVEIGTPGSLTGGVAIKHLLDEIDVKKALASTTKELSSLVKTKGVEATKVDNLVKKTKYLRTLDQFGMKPSEAYVLHNLPILPPLMRPAPVLSGGRIRWADINGLYKEFAQVNEQLGNPSLRSNLPEARLKNLRADLYSGMQAITGLAKNSGDDPKGLLEKIHGEPVKSGYFQNVLMNRRQDLSMRSVIVPEPSLHLDEVGLPEKKAMTLYKPFVVRKLVQIGAAAHPLEAQSLIKSESKAARSALELVIAERPVILKRDPALHKHSALAFTPKLVSGRSIKIHPLVTGGFNADFDGDTMSAYVPISADAVAEARNMFPSNNLYNEATGKVMYQPTLESALGLYKLSTIRQGAARAFASPVEAIKAAQTRSLHVNDPITVSGATTTVGRLLLANALPPAMKDDMIKGKIPVDRSGLNALFTTLAKDHASSFGAHANKLKDLGNGMASGAVELRHPDHQGPTAIIVKENQTKNVQFIPTTTHTLSLNDFLPDKSVRDPIFNRARQEVSALSSSRHSDSERERRMIHIWTKAGEDMNSAHKEKMGRDPSNLAIMQLAGVKPDWAQYQQMILAPVLVRDATGRTVPHALTRSYSEGLSVADYWTQMSGARRGTVMKVQEVRGPGALSKSLIASAVNLVVTGNDCGTQGGVALPAASSDVHDRILAKEFSAKGLVVPAGSLLNPDVVGKIRAADKNAALLVRSPLKCQHGIGLCQKCAGVSPSGQLHNIGTNLGLLAAQSLGERSIQLSMKAFHSGGIVSAGGKLTDDFTRIEQLTKLYKTLPNSAVMSRQTGTVSKVEKDATGTKVWIGDIAYHIGKDQYGRGLNEHVPGAQELAGYKSWQPPTVGMRVTPGHQLTDPNRTVINPHDLYRATKSMDRVQNFLVDELHSIYGREGVRRGHVETVVKAIGNLTKVSDPGDSDGVLPGEFKSMSKVQAMNAELIKAGKQPIEHVPILKGVDMLPFDVQEDWMAKLQHNHLTKVLRHGAATGSISNLHGLHPVPGIAYGAEFGLTSDKAMRPGLSHLKDVPTYAY